MVQSTNQTPEINVLIGYIQQLKHICTHTVSSSTFKKQRVHQGFRAFEKPFNDLSRDID